VDSLNLYKGPTKFWNAIKSFKNSHYFEDRNAVSTSDTQIIIDNYISNYISFRMVWLNLLGNVSEANTPLFFILGLIY